jgi:hypothetical protein
MLLIQMSEISYNIKLLKLLIILWSLGERGRESVSDFLLLFYILLDLYSLR